MDHCALCMNRPEPLTCQWAGSLRLEAGDGCRRLLGVFTPEGPAQLHFVEVGGDSRVWPDGTRAVVTPLRAEFTFSTEVDAWPAFADAAAYADWNERILAELDPTFRFADGETFGPEDVLPEEIQRGTHGPGLDFMDLGDPTDPDGPRQIRCHLYLLAPRLLEAEQVAGLELGGEWYEFPAE